MADVGRVEDARGEAVVQDLAQRRGPAPIALVEHLGDLRVVNGSSPQLEPQGPLLVGRPGWNRALDPPLEPLPCTRAVGYAGDLGVEQRLLPESQRLQQELLLGVEVVHDVARAHARPLGDVGDPGLREPSLQQGLGGRLQHARTPLRVERPVGAFGGRRSLVGGHVGRA